MQGHSLTRAAENIHLITSQKLGVFRSWSGRGCLAPWSRILCTIAINKGRHSPIGRWNAKSSKAYKRIRLSVMRVQITRRQLSRVAIVDAISTAGVDFQIWFRPLTPTGLAPTLTSRLSSRNQSARERAGPGKLADKAVFLLSNPRIGRYFLAGFANVLPCAKWRLTQCGSRGKK